ncbi:MULTISPECIES: hypothetical protein [unclassified Clostridium]|uniref:hypothetical protein n=1 Tax=unclassified Clostridium TaxID=2614128 RepID=UPI00207A0068|nr:MULTISPECIES: hypothetical protein [unclassified Clostridium]
MNLGEYKSFLYFVKERITELKDLDITINIGDKFSLGNSFGIFTILVNKKLDNKIDRMTYNYIENKINKNIYQFISNYTEVFAFLHEIGHILTSDTQEYYNYSTDLKTIKTEKYNNEYEAYTAYRNIEAEQLADNFAINFTNKYFYEIIKYFTGMDNKQVNDFIEILNY